MGEQTQAQRWEVTFLRLEGLAVRRCPQEAAHFLF